MPSRPRSHQLEDESERAFQNAMPSNWVYRRMDRDYGIDGQIEVFEEPGGNASGDMFFIQFKATEHLRASGELVVRLKADTLAYYRSLKVPVLLVAYSTAAGGLFIKWCHWYPISEYLGRKTVGMKFGPHDKWDTGDGQAGRT